jgi:hypothetical protein
MPATRRKGTSRSLRAATAAEKRAAKVAAILITLEPYLYRTISTGRNLIIVSVIEDTGNAAKALGHKGPGPNPPGRGIIGSLTIVG